MKNRLNNYRFAFEYFFWSLVKSPCRHYQQHIPVAVLGISRVDYPELKLKAWTNRVMTAFLAVCLQEACTKYSDPIPGRLALACAAVQKLSEWLLLLEMTKRYMSQTEADNIYKLANEWLSITSLFLMLWYASQTKFIKPYIYLCFLLVVVKPKVSRCLPLIGQANCTSQGIAISTEAKTPCCLLWLRETFSLTFFCWC